MSPPLLHLDLPLFPACKGKVSPKHEDRSSSLEPGEPLKIKQEQEDPLHRPEEAEGPPISYTFSGKNVITTDVKSIVLMQYEFITLSEAYNKLCAKM